MDNPAQLLTQVGIMNKISTGNTVLDLLLCMMLPLLLTHLTPHLDSLKQWWQSRTTGSKKWQREIMYTRKEYWSYGNDDEAPNNLLQQAILMYLGTKQDLCSQYTTAQLSLAKKPIIKSDKASDKSSGCADGESSSEDSYECAYDTARQLKSYQVNTVPPTCHWVEVEPGVEFQRVENYVDKGGDGKRADTIVTFHLQSSAANGPTRIDAFVDAAYAYYKAALEEKSEKVRYLYAPANGNGSGGDDSNKNGMCYKQYQLSDEKTFDSFWHPEKDALLRLVDHFLHKTGKYAIAGYSHKLGLLLHGPPGTGKTSLVKALAHFTDRNIISVPLAQIQTNQQLADIVFDQTYKVVGEDLPYSLPFSKTIFLLEDVDAACDVVQRRSPAARASPARKASTFGRRSASPAVEDSEGSPVRPGSPRPGSDSDGGAWQVVPGPLHGPEPKKRLATMAGFGDPPDKLNLAGLLNVLDGVVCCPNRIVVMTTNYVDKLDPALIRPGRVSKQVYMGHLSLASALQMVQHYFCSTTGGALSAAEVAAFTAAFPDGVVSPAEMEMLCCDVDTVDELVAALKRRQS